MLNQKELLEKVNKMKKGDLADLSSKEDLAIGVMNLISLEEHFFFTYHKTGKKEYLNLLNEMRSLRKKYLAQIVSDPEGEVWCISKHLLASSMRLMEVGTKKLGEKKEKEAAELFGDSFKLWNLFWGLNLNLLDVKDIKREKSDKEPEKEEYKKEELLSSEADGSSVFGKLAKVVNKILDCCRE